MSEKKNIDRLFQEQLKDFEAAPPEYVWENIREALEEKKKRRVLPLWFRLSGAAALLLAGLFLGWDYLSGNAGFDTNATPQVVTAPDGQTGTAKDGVDHATGADNAANKTYANPQPGGAGGSVVSNTNADSNSSSAGNAVVASGGADTAKSPIETEPRNRSEITTNAAVVAGSNAYGNKKSIAKDNDSYNGKFNKGLDNSSAVAVANKNHAKRKVKTTGVAKQTAEDKHADNPDIFKTPAVEGIVSNSKAGNNKQPKVSDKNVSNAQVADEVNKADGYTVASGMDADKASQSVQDNKINSNNGGVVPELTVVNKDVMQQEALAEVTIDTVKPQPENALEKLLKEKEEGKKEEQLADAASPKWNIKPQIAPVFYNSLSGGSPIDGQFAGNSKSFDNDLSYGLGVNYAVNKRLSVRTGVNRVNLNYATQGIEFYASLEGATNNIATARSRNATIIVQNQSVIDAAPMLSANGLKDSYSGSMVQSTGYVEIPLEMSYSLLNKRFGIAVIGGVSTLFLNENNVSVVSRQGLTANVGEAENLNDIHFSTNVGLGFRYRFFKSFEANFEPMFKYQVNTYSREAGNFKPYFIGLYSGISFSF